MKRFLGVFSGLLLTCISAYLLLTQYNISAYSFPDIQKSDYAAANAVVQSIQPLIQKISQDVGTALQYVFSKGDALADAAIEKVKVETFGLVKDSISGKIDQVGSGLGIAVSQGQSSEGASPVVFAMKRGEPAYFTIENRENERIQYEVDWQDSSEKDIGSLDAEKSRVVSHSWSKAGTYAVQFKIAFSDKINTYHVTLSIF